MEDREETQRSERSAYERPSVRKLGTLLELTEAGGESLPTEVIFPNSSQS